MSITDGPTEQEVQAMRIGTEMTAVFDAKDLDYDTAAMASMFVVLGAKHAKPERFETLWKRVEGLFLKMTEEIKQEKEK